jgi:hypothetical protein
MFKLKEKDERTEIDHSSLLMFSNLQNIFFSNKIITMIF